MSDPAEETTGPPTTCVVCGSALPAGARFCPGCGAKVEGESVPPAEAVEEGVPAELKARIETTRAELQGDRRRVVILFADLEGYTAWSEGRDPEEVTLLVGRVLEDMAGAVQQYGGYVDKYIGDAIMALFGAPISHEDDAERAVLAGLDMVERVRRRREDGLPLSLRVGIHAGEVVAAHLGGGGRPQYTVIGDAVNVASRLEREAEADSVLVSDAVHARIVRRFTTVARDPVVLKGREEAVRPHRILAPREGAHGRPHGSPFVGREEELAAFAAFLARQGGALALEAEPGVGKSRLAREALTRHGGRVVEIGFSAVRYPGEREAPADLFRRLAGGEGEARRILGAGAEEHAAGLAGLARAAGGGAGPEELDPAAGRQNRWLALAALLAASGPLTLLVEDAHWADETAREFLAFLVRDLEGAPVTILLTARPGTPLPAGVERMELQPLGAAAAARLLERLGAGLEGGLRHDVLRRAAGNPLFLEELARTVGESPGGAASVPDTIEGLVRARIDRLEGDAAAALPIAAVLGDRFPVALLEQIYRLERPAGGFAAALDALVGDGFLEVTRDRGGFRHALLQEVAYAGILLRVRKVLHESAARLGEAWFEDRQEAEAPFFAHHWWEAGHPEDALPHLWAAGRAAAAAYDLPAAERWLGRAAEALADHPGALGDRDERARFHQTLANVLLLRGELEEADGWCERLTGDERPEWRSRGLEMRGRVAWYRGKLDEARERFQEGLTLLAGEPVTERSRRVTADLHNDLGIVYYYRGVPDEAFAHHGEALALREEMGDLLGMAKSQSNIGNLLHHFRHDLQGADDRYRRALELATEVGNRKEKATALHNLGYVSLERGRYRRALRIFRRSVRLSERIGWRHLAWVGIQNAAACETALGRIDEAIARLERCRREGDAVLEPVNRVNTRLYLFDAWLRALSDDRAEEALEEARRLVAELAAEEVESEVALGEGRLLAARGQWVEAAEAFRRAREDAEGRGYLAVARLAAAHRTRALAKAGAPPEGGNGGGGNGGNDYGGDGECGAETEGPVSALVAYLSSDAMAARGPSLAAAAALEDAAARAAAIEDPALERAALASLAKVHFGRGDEEAARETLARVARLTLLLADGLPGDLRASFLDHPRSAV